MEQIALGLSMRNYEHSIEALCDGYGIKKSSVSRHFITASRRELEELLGSQTDGSGHRRGFSRWSASRRPLRHRRVRRVARWCEALSWSLGARSHREWRGVCEALFEDLIGRGFDPKQRRLFIVDGSEGVVVGDPEDVSWL